MSLIEDDDDKKGGRGEAKFKSGMRGRSKRQAGQKTNKNNEDDGDDVKAMTLEEAYNEHRNEFKDVKAGFSEFQDFKNMFKAHCDSMSTCLDVEAKDKQEINRMIGLMLEWLQNLDKNLTHCPLPLVQKINEPNGRKRKSDENDEENENKKKTATQNSEGDKN